MAESILEEAAFRCWAAHNGFPIDGDGVRQAWAESPEITRKAWEAEPRITLAYVAEIAESHRQTCIGQTDYGDGYRDAAANIAAKLSGE